ncbi:MAG: DUF5615 family PIN-like protein [Planctomycetota bacterium]
MTVRFHLDENIDPALAEALRRRGIEVTTSAESGLNGCSDREQLEFAGAQRRVAVTHDADFLRLAKEGVSHCGIVFCPVRRFSVGRVTMALVALGRYRTADDMVGRIEFL